MFTIILTYYYLLGFETVQFGVRVLAFHRSGIPTYYIHPNNWDRSHWNVGKHIRLRGIAPEKTTVKKQHNSGIMQENVQHH